MSYFSILLGIILVNNYVLVQFLGICPFLGVSKKLDSSVGMGLAVIAVMLIATAVTFPLQMFLLDANGLGYMQTIIFILGMMIMVEGMAISGFFSWLCLTIARAVKYNTTKIFVMFMLFITKKSFLQVFVAGRKKYL